MSDKETNSMIYRLCGKRDELIEIIHYLSEKKMKLSARIIELQKEIEQ